MDALAGQCVQIDRQRCRQRLAFAGLHFGDTSIVEHHTADHLHVERTHFQRSRGCLTHHGKGFRQQRVEGGIADDALVVSFQFLECFAALFAFGVHDFRHALLEFGSFGLKSFVGQRFRLGFECIDFIRDFAVFGNVTFVAVKEFSEKFHR